MADHQDHLAVYECLLEGKVCPSHRPAPTSSHYGRTSAMFCEAIPAIERCADLQLLTLRFVTGQDVAGALPCARADELERHRGTFHKERRAFACDQREDREVQFVDEIMVQQVIPERAPGKDEDIS